MGFELTCSGGSFSGKNVDLMLSRNELQSDCSTSVAPDQNHCPQSASTSVAAAAISPAKTSLTFCASELQSESSMPVCGRIKLSSSIGFEVNCSGGSFSGCRASRILLSKRAPDGLVQFSWRQEVQACPSEFSFPGLAGSVVCSAINSIYVPQGLIGNTRVNIWTRRNARARRALTLETRAE